MISKDELVAALQSLSPDQLAGILAQGHGRSPILPRQLDDLRERPSATNPRPLFIPSVEVPVGTRVTQSEYPKLFWHAETGQEITCRSREEYQEKYSNPKVWVSYPPDTTVDPEAAFKAMFEGLSDEDKAFVLEYEQQQRQDAIRSAMNALRPSQLASVLSAPVKKAKH